LNKTIMPYKTEYLFYKAFFQLKIEVLKNNCKFSEYYEKEKVFPEKKLYKIKYRCYNLFKSNKKHR